jgi:hypothetical protein
MTFAIAGTLGTTIAGGLSAAGLGAATAGAIGSVLGSGIVGAGLGAGGSALLGGDPGQGALMGGLGGGLMGGLGGLGSAAAGTPTAGTIGTLGTQTAAALTPELSSIGASGAGMLGNASGAGGLLGSSAINAASANALTPALSSFRKRRNICWRGWCRRFVGKLCNECCVSECVNARVEFIRIDRGENCTRRFVGQFKPSSSAAWKNGFRHDEQWRTPTKFSC